LILLSQLALRQIAAHSESNLECEVGGAMLGRAFRSSGQLFVEVRAAIPAVTEDHGPVHFTFTADAWSQLHKDRVERYPDLDIVGWFHTHPDLGVFYSSDDVVVHSAAFTLPWHVGMVVDPLRKETAFFGWRAGELQPTTGFYELRDVQPYSLLEWELVRTAVWDHPYEYSEHEVHGGGGSRVFLPPSNNINLPGLRYFGLGMGILGLLLSFFLLVGMVLPLSREVDRLQNMVIVLADKALAESNAAYCPDPNLRILAPVTGVRATVGSPIEVMGTAMLADASGYQINIRPAESSSWDLVGERSRGTKLGQLATWDTAAAAVGDYELRLTAVDSNNIRIAGSPPCSIAVELVP
jgi:proteasome lid subunit RPN8/RPN11